MTKATDVKKQVEFTDINNKTLAKEKHIPWKGDMVNVWHNSTHT